MGNHPGVLDWSPFQLIYIQSKRRIWDRFERVVFNLDLIIIILKELFTWHSVVERLDIIAIKGNISIFRRNKEIISIWGKFAFCWHNRERRMIKMKSPFFKDICDWIHVNICKNDLPKGISNQKNVFINRMKLKASNWG